MILKKLNLSIVVLPLMVFSLGLLTLLSIAPDLSQAQAGYFFVGVILYIFFSFFDYTFFKYYWKYAYLVTVALLIATFLMGEVRSGSSRWLDLGFFTLQPSELAKVVLVVTIAALVSSKKDYLKSVSGVVFTVLAVLPIFFLVFIQPDLGTSLVSVLTLVLMLFFGGISFAYFLVGFIVVGFSSAPFWEILKPYQQQRILVFLNPQLDTKGAGYNVIQSIIAVGSGGLLGRGFGRGTQSHLKFLPAHWTDFIFASFAEEWGFLGVLVLCTLLFALLFSILYVVYRARDMFGSMLAFGVFSILFLQITINIGMNIGLMPVTGIPLPLFSYGGSSLIVTMIMLGIVQSVWIHGRYTR